MQLTRKVALITGVGRGLGRGIALAFAREGAVARYCASMAPEAQRSPLAELLTDGITEAMAVTGAALDLAEVLRAVHRLSGASTVGRLLVTMMAMVVEHTGARRGVFLREDDGRWRVVARHEGGCGGVTRLAPVPCGACEEVPWGILHYVKRTGEAVCLDDARSDERFAADPYLRRQQPKSVVCLPIATQARLLGILYLEDSLSPYAFTPPRLALLQVLAWQLAMVFEQAQVQAALEQAIEARQQAEAALQQARAEVAQLHDRLQAEHGDFRLALEGDYDCEGIVGHSPALRRVLHQVEQVAGPETTVLIQGETGTGKELLARAIHQHSARRERPLVTVNCAALPPTLVESELFGYEKGAFTGALTRKVGRFELAHAGTLFLDEIGELPLDVQAKLLRVLQDGEFERLGSVQTTTVNVRVIAATNRNLVQRVAAGHFREDLYYRLNVFPMTLPPLRERREDIPLLVWSVVAQCQGKLGKTIERIPARAMAMLVAYPWPGNVRELANVIERAIILSPVPTLVVDEVLGASALSDTDPPSLQLLEDVERAHILAVLDACQWHIKGEGQAAARLGLHPSTLYSRMRKLGIERRA
jgi:transcriptional regulator with GAF, ATPase, and Fis domain